MDYMERMTEAVHYIERNLKGKLHLEQISSYAAYSKYHFQRLFQHVTGETAGRYIMNRRLTEAAREINRRPHASIIDIALEYGFESHETFTRAFKKRYGITPSLFKKNGKLPPHLLTEPVSLDYVKQISSTMNVAVELRRLEELRVKGYETEVLEPHAIHEQWERLNRSLLRKAASVEMYGIIRLQEATCSLEADYSYLAAAQSDEVEEGCGQREAIVLPGSYAMFRHIGPAAVLPFTYQYIYGTWLAQSGYKLAGTYDFERYDHRFLGAEHPHSELDIFVPVTL